MTSQPKHPPPLWDEDEDYTDSVCLLLPKGHATLVDSDFFEWACQFEWKVLGRSIFYSTRWYCPRGTVTSMSSLHRAAIGFGLGDNEKWNLSVRLRRRDVDHINRNPWDNRRRNLRPATRSQNTHNRPGRASSSSKYKGVTKKKGTNRWLAAATIRGIRHHLGTFDEEIDAAIAYNRFVAERCGEYAYLNPITITGVDTPTPRR